MTYRVRFRGIESSAALREHAERRLHRQLGRYRQQITSVALRLTDINGPRGGSDKQCQITVRGGSGIGSVDVSVTHEDAYAAVDLAMERVRRAVGRSIQRSREPRRPAASVAG